MTEEVDSVLIKEVQTVLGKYIKKPPLNEKLLKKPPFRYLHDLITSIIRETGYLNEVYSDTELNSENVKDKDAKLNFLDKLISAVKKSTGTNVTARSGKIIAGLEVNKTLELLLVIGKTIENEVNNSKKDEKTEKCGIPRRKPPIDAKSSNKTNPSPKKEAVKTQPSTSKSVSSGSKSVAPKDKALKTEINRKNTASDQNSASSRKSSGQNKPPSSRKPSLQEANKNLNVGVSVIEEERENSSRVKEDPNNGNIKSDIIKEDDNQNIINNKENENKNTPETTPVVNDELEPKNKTLPQSQTTDPSLNRNEKSPVKKKENAPVQRPGSARPGSRRVSYSNSLKNGELESETMKGSKPEKKPDSEEPPTIPITRPRTATRPPSARPGAPRIRDRGEVSINDETKQPLANINVIEEGKADQVIDEKDNFIVIESEQNILASTDDAVQINDQDQGQLVNQILQTQKELNESLTVDVSQHKHSEIEWEAGRQRERDIVGKEVDKIRSVIQTLTSAANPLGKLFDFLQEDVDEMQRELQHWKKINENLQKQQLAETNAGKMFLQPLQKQLEDVENSIREEYLQIANIKSTILLNDEKIMKLINGTQTRTKL